VVLLFFYGRETELSLSWTMGHRRVKEEKGGKENHSTPGRRDSLCQGSKQRGTGGKSNRNRRKRGGTGRSHPHPSVRLKGHSLKEATKCRRARRTKGKDVSRSWAFVANIMCATLKGKRGTNVLRLSKGTSSAGGSKNLPKPDIGEREKKRPAGLVNPEVTLNLG